MRQSWPVSLNAPSDIKSRQFSDFGQPEIEHTAAFSQFAKTLVSNPAGQETPKRTSRDDQEKIPL